MSDIQFCSGASHRCFGKFMMSDAKDPYPLCIFAMEKHESTTPIVTSVPHWIVIIWTGARE